jgi:hypothetical protein
MSQSVSQQNLLKSQSGVTVQEDRVDTGEDDHSAHCAGGKKLSRAEQAHEDGQERQANEKVDQFEAEGPPIGSTQLSPGGGTGE